MPKADDSRLYKRGSVWWLAYRGLRRSLQTSDLRLARAARHREIEKIDRERLGLQRYSWADGVGAWLSQAPGSHSASTINRYMLSFRVARAWLEPLYLDEIDRKTLAKIGHRPGVTNATRRRDLTAISSVLNHAVSRGWIEFAPKFDRSGIRERRELIALPLPAEVEQFAQACPGKVLGNLVRLLRYTGMRLEEAASLQWRQVDMDRRTITLERTKGNRVRVVPLSEDATRTLSRTLRRVGCPWVFWHSGVKDCDRYHHLDTYLMKVRRAEGLAWRTHDLRHLFAVEYLKAGGSLYTLQGILGHTTIRTTEGYLDHLAPEEAARAKGVG
jgi:integrase/recombinase XerD